MNRLLYVCLIKNPPLIAVFTFRGLQSAERSLIISLAFCKTSGLAAASRLGGGDGGCTPIIRDIRNGAATLVFKIHL